MVEESMTMPSSGGGLVRYFNEYKSKIQLEPMHVILIIAVFIVLEVIVRL